MIKLIITVIVAMRRLIYLLLIMIKTHFMRKILIVTFHDSINNFADYTKITSKQNNIAADCKYGVELSAEWAQYILKNKNICSCPKAYELVKSFSKLLTHNQMEN